MHRFFLNITIISIVFCLIPSFDADAQQSDKVVSLDDIKFVYHGIPLDEQRKPFNLDTQQIGALYLELMDNIAANEVMDKELLNTIRQSNTYQKITEKSLFNQPGSTKQNLKELDFLADVMTSGISGENLVDGRNQYLSELKKLRSFTNFGLSTDSLSVDKSLEKYLAPFSSRNAVEHRICSDQTVPKPPSFGSPLWKPTISIPTADSLLFHDDVLSSGNIYPDTKVSFYYKKTLPRGLCALLRRYQVTPKDNPKLSLALAGAICESEATGNTCFWENSYKTSEGPTISIKEISMPPFSDIQKSWSNSANGVMRENCLRCHGGNNAFIFYKRNKLCFGDLDENGDLDDIFIDDNAQCFGRGTGTFMTPIGLTPPVDILKVEPGLAKNKCLKCHDFAVSSDTKHFCALLDFVTGKFMPPTEHKTGLEWNGTGDPNNPFKASVDQLRNFCTN